MRKKIVGSQPIGKHGLAHAPAGWSGVVRQKEMIGHSSNHQKAS